MSSAFSPQVEFAGQLREVRAVFEEERSQLLSRITALQRELDESQGEREREQGEREREQRGWRETLEGERWKERVAVTERDMAGEREREREWTGDGGNEAETLRRTLAEERTRVSCCRGYCCRDDAR